MEYTTILTHQLGTLWQAFVPVLPDCSIKGSTRDEILPYFRSEAQQKLSNFDKTSTAYIYLYAANKNLRRRKL